MLCAHSRIVNSNLHNSHNSSQQYHNNTNKSIDKMHYGNKQWTIQTLSYVRNQNVKVDL